MLMAALGDVHGNIQALQQALEIIDDLGIQLVVNTGDLVVGHPYPNEVIDLVQQRDIPSVQGKFDRLIGLFERRNRRLIEKLAEENRARLEETHRLLRLEHVEYLRNLPHRWHRTAESIEILLCHGSPESPTEAIDPHAPESRFLRAREAANARLIILGMTHQPFTRTIADTWFVNPGPLGFPVSGSSAGTFALIDTDSDPWRVEFREVELQVK